MPGRGPAPKLPDQRVRRNVPTSGDWVELPPASYKGPTPPTPDGLSTTSLWTWSRWWESPMAHMWVEADWPGLMRLILLIDNGSKSDASEIRLQEERFGLSPSGRQKLRWLLPAGDEPEQVKRPKAKRDRRSASLEVISGG